MSTYVIHSFVEKLWRAEKHIEDLEVEIAKYAARHPYTVCTGFESKKKPNVNRLKFIEYPDTTDIPLIAADAIYSIRSALDHLMAALVHRNQRRKVYFPIFFKGVWNDDLPGEDKKRTDERARWRSYTKSIKPGALAILKELQPRDGARNDDPTVNFITILNSIAVKDRHVKLPFLAPSLRDYRVTCTRADGITKVGLTGLHPDKPLDDGAIINGLPKGAMNVEIKGTPVVSIDISNPHGNLPVPEMLNDGVAKCNELIVGRLAGYVRA
jgi:hypothetical protein